MRWTPTEVERATAELDPALRVAGVGQLLEHLTTVGEIADPSVWCAGTVGSQAAVLVCDPWRLDSYQLGPGLPGSSPARHTWPVDGIVDLVVDPALGGFTLGTPRDGRLVVGDVPRSLLGPFVAHLIARIPARFPTPRRIPGLSSSGEHS